MTMDKSNHVLVCTLALFLLAPGARAQSADADDPDAAQPARPQAIEYDDAYYIRAKIHKIASWATLPLLGTEAILGQNTFNNPPGQQSSSRNAHIVVGSGITAFFVAQTATGLWNLVDSWKDPNHQKLRRLHSIMMLGANAGFVAAYGTTPDGNNLVTFDQEKRTHRAIVFTSMGVATASYLLMLFGNR